MAKFFQSANHAFLARFIAFALFMCYLGTGNANAQSTAQVNDDNTQRIWIDSVLINGERTLYKCYITDSVEKKVSISDYTDRIIGTLEIPREVTLHGRIVTGSISSGIRDLGTYTVEGIGAYAFRNQNMISEVIIPETVKFIGSRAFDNCNINYLTIGKGVEEIGDEAFRWCPLFKITLPEGLKTIGKMAFSQSLEDRKHGNLRELVIPNSVTEIGEHAFAFCYELKKLVLGSSVKSIGDWAFNESQNLESITILSQTPPTVYDKSFSSYLSKSTALYIPDGTFQAYINTTPWKNLKIIDPTMPTGFIVEVNGKIVENIFTEGLSMVEGETVEIKAITEPYIENLKLTWSNNNPMIAYCSHTTTSCNTIVSIEAFNSGSATVTINAPSIDLSKSFKLTVLPGIQPEQIKLSDTSLNIIKGESTTITAEVLPEDAVTKNVTWTSTDESVVKVDPNGNVSAVGVGQAQIIATCRNATASCDVTVEYQTPTDICTLSYYGRYEEIRDVTIADNMHPGISSGDFIVLPEDAPQFITATSSNESIIGIETECNKTKYNSSLFRWQNYSSIKYKYNDYGTSVITLTTENISKEFKVTIAPKEISGISISLNDDIPLSIGETKQASCKIYPADASDQTITWASCDESIATIDDMGIITPLKVGSTYITLTSMNGASDTCKIIVKENLPISVGFDNVVSYMIQDMPVETNLLYFTLNMRPGDTRGFTVKQMDQESIIATSSDDSIVTVHRENSTFWLSAKSAGEASITLTSNNEQVELKVTVHQTERKKLLKLPQLKYPLFIGDKKSLLADIYPIDTNPEDIRWKSCDESIATVDDNGEITAVAPGVVKIVAIANEEIATSEVIVIPQNTSLNIEKSKHFYNSDRGDYISTSISPHFDFNVPIIWESSDESVVTVREHITYSWGVDIDPKGPGKAIIIATITPEITDTCEVFVEGNAESIILNETIATLTVDQTIDLKATVLPENSLDKSVSWRSYNESIATVDANGRVTAKKIGTTAIYANVTYNPNVFTTCNITVVETPAESIEINKEAMGISDNYIEMRAGEHKKIEFTILPETTTDKRVLYSSSDHNIATVDDSGEIHAYQVGDVTITITARSGVSTTLQVKVLPTPVETIEIDRTKADIEVNQHFFIHATVYPTDATDKSVMWESDDESIASVETIDGYGDVTAHKPGTAHIIARSYSNPGVYAICEVNVLGIPAERIDIYIDEYLTSPYNDIEMHIGDMITAKATVLPESTTDKSVTWSSGNPDVATVDTNGNVKAISTGAATIVATATSGVNSFFKVIVLEDSGISGITADPEEVEYYTLNGIRIYKENLVPGVYIRRKGNKFEKVIIK